MYCFDKIVQQHDFQKRQNSKKPNDITSKEVRKEFERVLDSPDYPDYPEDEELEQEQERDDQEDAKKQLKLLQKTGFVYGVAGPVF